MMIYLKFEDKGRAYCCVTSYVHPIVHSGDYNAHKK